MLKIMIVKAHFLSQWKAFMKELRVNPHILLLTSHDFDLFKVMSDLQTQGNQQWEQPPFTWWFSGSSQGREGSFRLFSSVTGPGLLHLLVIPTWRTRKHIIKNKNPFLSFGTFFSSPLIYSLRKWPWLVEWMNEWKKKKKDQVISKDLKKDSCMVCISVRVQRRQQGILPWEGFTTRTWVLTNHWKAWR